MQLCVSSVLALAALLTAPASADEASEWRPIKVLQAPVQLQQRPPAWVPANQRRPARAASGPSHLVAGLLGRCLLAAAAGYEFALCPFANATQGGGPAPPLLPAAAFGTVVGVWNGWYVEDNRFVAMAMTDGDSCENRRRSATVRLACSSGNATQLASVLESPRCHYHMLLATPLVCHRQALLVYPTLGARQRAAWDTLWTLRQRGELETATYRLLVDNLLHRAGLLTDA